MRNRFKLAGGLDWPESLDTIDRLKHSTEVAIRRDSSRVLEFNSNIPDSLSCLRSYKGDG